MTDIDKTSEIFSNKLEDDDPIKCIKCLLEFAISKIELSKASKKLFLFNNRLQASHTRLYYHRYLIKKDTSLLLSRR
ncbi:hypothetical protein CDL12_15000 [Handroanthus impetiginosus]|uniref:Uncharacterized protein n=1 Tax=Handroanthus impetiginosus TaxID=429701 RepID=A0A2G9GQJ3_9LAMI|nr:hypothetical protein CDL12_19900 [Handroanthus impetiginosus]PIN12395.1 hypothetical protein CDL12_15000 [Handroanthus impetiginosus]